MAYPLRACHFDSLEFAGSELRQIDTIGFYVVGVDVHWFSFNTVGTEHGNIPRWISLPLW